MLVGSYQWAVSAKLEILDLILWRMDSKWMCLGKEMTAERPFCRNTNLTDFWEWPQVKVYSNNPVMTGYYKSLIS